MISKNHENNKNIKLKHNDKFNPMNEYTLMFIIFVPANFCLFSFVELTSLL